jgi:hypothetical protein
MPRVVVLADYAGCHCIGINFEVKAARGAIATTITLLWDVVVEQGDVALVMVESGVVL